MLETQNCWEYYSYFDLFWMPDLGCRCKGFDGGRGGDHLAMETKGRLRRKSASQARPDLFRNPAYLVDVRISRKARNKTRVALFSFDDGKITR